MIMLDTSAVIQLLRGSDIPNAWEDESIGISVVVEMELHLGALHGGGRREQKRVDDFLTAVKIFDFDRAAALETARVLAKLWSKGTPIGDFDAQIAGHALQLRLPLLTTNPKHFRRVDGLQVEIW
ncbi:MAG: type II toxin-antitoxin system VapC family toxin [Verrucomicrobiota bacterium]